MFGRKKSTTEQRANQLLKRRRYHTVSLGSTIMISLVLFLAIALVFHVFELVEQFKLSQVIIDPAISTQVTAINSPPVITNEPVIVKDATITIASLQGATLSITALAVTVISAITAIYSIYREKRIDSYNKEIEKQLYKLKGFEQNYEFLMHMNALQIMEKQDMERYYDAIKQYIDAELFIEDGKMSHMRNDHFDLALMNISVEIAKKTNDEKKQLDLYDDIVRTGEALIKKKSATLLDQHFAYMETITALYNSARINIQMNPSVAMESLEKAKKHLRNVSRLNDDDQFGHIANLKGLVFFWLGKSLMPDKENEKLKHFKKALDYFHYACDANGTRRDFQNNKAVCNMNLFALTKDYSYLEGAEETYRRLMVEHPTHSLAFINSANISIMKIKELIGLNESMSQKDFVGLQYGKETSREKMSEGKKHYNDAADYLESAKKHLPRIVDPYVLTIELYNSFSILNKRYNKNYDVFQHKDIIEPCIKEGEKIRETSIRLITVKRNYYALIGETALAEAENNKLKDTAPHHYDNWLKD